MMKSVHKINILIFLYYLIAQWSLDKTIKIFISKYGDVDFVIYFPIFRFKLWIIRSNDRAKSVLSKTDAKLTYINKNFTASHGHKYGIGNIDIDNELWYRIHKGLHQSIDINYLKLLMDKHSHIITYKYGFKYNVNEVLSEYIITVWAQYCFGPLADIQYYKTMRSKLITTLRRTFYDNQINYIPIIGSLICSIKRYYYRKNFAEIDKMLNNLININSDGFIHKFAKIINNHEIIIDNAFLSVLVYDFIFNLILQRFLNEDTMYNNLKHSFLYPYRIRWISKSADDFKKNDLVIINMVDSNVPFSYGPRSCVGTVFMHKFYEIFNEIIDPYTIIYDKNPIIRSENNNIPEVLSQHMVTLMMKKDRLSNMIDNFPHKGIEKFYRIESITENPCLYNYICNSMARMIQNNPPDVLITSEARGFLLSPIAIITKLPLITIRKSNKIAGQCISESYQKKYDSKETLEMSIHSPIIGKRAVILDDGIATGETTKAIYNLIKKSGGETMYVLVCIKHTYTEIRYKETDVKYIFEL